MGLLFNTNEEISEKVYKDFKDKENYLLAFKHNDFKTGIGKLLVSNLWYTFDSSRTFILYFSSKGIYEEEISNSVNRDFLLMPWHEIESFSLDEKKSKAIINLNHLGKKVAYEIPFDGKIFKDNKISLEKLISKNRNKIDE